MMKDALFAGVNAAVLTPMRADLSVDLDRMASHSRWLLANGCDNLGVLGTTGEANSIGISERLDILPGLVTRGIPATKMMPGTGVTALTDTVLLTRQAMEAGCRGALLLPPFYYKNPTDDGLFAYFSEVINRVGGGIKYYLYNFPQQSAVPFSVDLDRATVEGISWHAEGREGQQWQLRKWPRLRRELRTRRLRGVRRRRHVAASVAAGRERRLHHRGGEREFADRGTGVCQLEQRRRHKHA